MRSSFQEHEEIYNDVLADIEQFYQSVCRIANQLYAVYRPAAYAHPYFAAVHPIPRRSDTRVAGAAARLARACFAGVVPNIRCVGCVVVLGGLGGEGCVVCMCMGTCLCFLGSMDHHDNKYLFHFLKVVKYQHGIGSIIHT